MCTYSRPATRQAIKNPTFVYSIYTITGLLLRETAMLADVITEIATRQHVHHQIQVVPILEGIVHVDNEWVVELCKDLPLVHHRFDAPLSDDACLRHFLHRICLLGLLTLDLPDLPEAALPDAVLVVEIGFGQRCIKVKANEK